MSVKLQPQKEITVDGTKYIVQFYSPSFGLTLWAKLVRLFGEPIVKLMASFAGDKTKGKSVTEMLDLDISDVNLEGISDAIASLFSKLPDEQVTETILEILSQTFFTAPHMGDTISVHFETEFQGRYLHIFKLVAQTLGVQYPDFLGGMLKRSKGVSAAPASAKTTTK